MVDLMLIYDFMGGFYGGINGHQLVPLMPSGFVKTQGKGLGTRCMRIMVWALWCNETSTRLENGIDPNDLQVSSSISM